MRLLTVAEVLRLALPPETRVVAGADGLDRGVSWARVAGTRPLAAGSLEEGELVIFASLPSALAGEGYALSTRAWGSEPVSLPPFPQLELVPDALWP